MLFVFAWLVVGGEETEVRLLAKHLDPTRYRAEVVACQRRPGMPEQTHEQLTALGVPVDRTPYGLSFEETVEYLSGKLARYDLVVACQAVPDVYPALERLPPDRRPPLIEHGGLITEALAGPKHLTARYVGVCTAIRDAAAGQMPGRSHHAVTIPSMVDLGEFDTPDGSQVRTELGVAEGQPLIGWVGRLDPKKRVEDFIRSAALVQRAHSAARFVVIGGPDAFAPAYATELRELAASLGLNGRLCFLGDRPDVPRLLGGLDALVWLSRDEGLPHVIAEAGAAGLPVVATRDHGSVEMIDDEISGLFVPYGSPAAVAMALGRLIEDPALRRLLGGTLRDKVEREYSAAVVVPRWETLFDEVIHGD